MSLHCKVGKFILNLHDIEMSFIPFSGFDTVSQGIQVDSVRLMQGISEMSIAARLEFFIIKRFLKDGNRINGGQQ